MSPRPIRESSKNNFKRWRSTRYYQTFREPKTLHPLEEETRLPIEAILNFSISDPEHLLHAVNCTTTDQTKKAITGKTKLVHFASRGQLHVTMAPVFCIASLIFLKKLKEAIRPIAVGEVLRGLIAKGIAKQTQSELRKLFLSKQHGVGVTGGAESIIHATKLYLTNCSLLRKQESFKSILKTLLTAWLSIL